MIYFLTSVLFLFGVAYHVMSRISALRAKFPQLHKGEIVKTFFGNEWDSLIVSGLVLGTGETLLYILTVREEIKLPGWFDQWGIYLFALVMGYAGQRLVYKWLKTAEKALEDKVQGLGQ